MSQGAVQAEIEALHREFERWFAGESTSLDRVDQALAPDFLFVGPDGAIVARDQLLSGLEAARGDRRLTIWIERVELHWQRGDLLAATYEEWQRAPDGATTSRRSTAVFERNEQAPGGLRWLSVHETWL